MFTTISSQKKQEQELVSKKLYRKTSAAIVVRILDNNFHILTKTGAGERLRTPDLLITSQLLYQLSYASKLFHNKNRVFEKYKKLFQ